ncbi:50S ribosomal protein L18 [Thermodesulfobacteriota bacterium]
MARDINKTLARRKRTRRVRHRIKSVKDRSRLTVFRSNRNIFAQIIDDRNGVTLASASTLDKDLRRKPGEPFNKEVAKQVGKKIAALAKEKNIAKVVFDRGPYLYHGKVRALGEGAREGGLDF